MMPPLACPPIYRSDSPPYPYSLHLARSASTLIDNTPSFQANPQQHQANQQKITASIQANGLRATADSIVFLCDVAERVHSSFAITFKNADFNALKFLSQIASPRISLMVVTADEEKRLYISLKGNKIYQKFSPQGQRIFKITECLLFRFCKAGYFQGLQNYIKMSVPFEQTSRLTKRISATQQLRGYPFYPQTDDIVLYAGKQDKEKIAFYQPQAFCDLLHFHNEVLGLNELPDQRRICHDILSAIGIMHQKGLVHRDIKLDNFLVYLERITPCQDTCAKKFCKIHQKVQVKLTDFEYVCAISDLDDLRSRVGTRPWAAPEVIANDQTSLNGIAMDIWGLGHIFYIFSNGTPHAFHGCLKVRQNLFDEIRQLEQQIQTLANNESIQKELTQKLTILLEERKKACLDKKERKGATDLEKKKAFLSKDLRTFCETLKEFIQSANGLTRFVVDRINVSAQMRRLIRTLHEGAEDITHPNALEIASLETNLSTVDLAKDDETSKRLALLKTAKELHAFLETHAGQDFDATGSLQVKAPLIEFLFKLLHYLRAISLTADEIEKAKEPFVALLKKKMEQKKEADDSFEEIKKSLIVPQKRITTLNDLSQAMLVTDPASRLSLQTALNFLREKTQAPASTTDCAIL